MAFESEQEHKNQLRVKAELDERHYLVADRKERLLAANTVLQDVEVICKDINDELAKQEE